MKSMTGFGRGAAAGKDFTVSVELKTVNTRYLDVHLRVAGELQPFETVLKKRITDRISRGRVEVNLQYERTSEVQYELNRPLISGYLSALKELQDEFSLTGEPDLNFVARLPNALMTAKEEAGQDFENGLIEAVDSALADLEQMRLAEGVNLKADLGTMLAEIDGSLPLIESEAENVAGEYAEKLQKRIEKLLSKSESEIELDQSRLAQEVAYLADKSDISEEIARLKSHNEQFKSIMEEDGQVGKRLDFLTQELNREANTIASKTQNLTVNEAALRIKGEIEKIREQVQNVE